MIDAHACVANNEKSNDKEKKLFIPGNKIKIFFLEDYLGLNLKKMRCIARLNLMFSQCLKLC